jgi:hypothetical protein
MNYLYNVNHAVTKQGCADGLSSKSEIAVIEQKQVDRKSQNDVKCFS